MNRPAEPPRRGDSVRALIMFGVLMVSNGIGIIADGAAESGTGSLLQIASGVALVIAGFLQVWILAFRDTP